jgi:hypothetical protein
MKRLLKKASKSLNLDLNAVFNLCNSEDCFDYIEDNFNWYDFCSDYVEYEYDENSVDTYDITISENSVLRIVKEFLEENIVFPSNIQECLDLFKDNNLSELKNTYLKNCDIFDYLNDEEAIEEIKQISGFNAEKLKKAVLNCLVESWIFAEKYGQVERNIIEIGNEYADEFK